MKARKIDKKTFYAVAELVQAAAHQQGLTGPVEFTICGERDYDWCGVQDDYAEVTEEEFTAL